MARHFVGVQFTSLSIFNVKQQDEVITFCFGNNKKIPLSTTSVYDWPKNEWVVVICAIECPIRRLKWPIESRMKDVDGSEFTGMLVGSFMF